jgi:ribosomal protein S18 acetylase RimI-like enzyme
MQGLAKGQELTIEWLSTQQMRRILLDTARHFGKNRKRDPNIAKLGLIQSEIWMARQALQPYPQISIVRDNLGRIVGVMCGFPFSDHFYIQHIAIHPEFSHIQDGIEEQLIESAIDESTRLGFRGWVACSPEPDEQQFWRAHGFYRQSDDLYRRMGYFVTGVQ